MNTSNPIRKVVRLKISDIKIPKGRHPEDDISELVLSMKVSGLINPVTVTKKRKTLIAGRNRIAAALELGWTHIDCLLVPYNEITAELIEIDENLCRKILKALERSELLSRQEQLLLSLKEAQSHGGDRRSKETLNPRLEKKKPFSKLAESFEGKKQRTIQDDLKIAKDIPDDVKALIQDHDIADRKTDLLKLSREDPKEQEAIARLLIDGSAKSFSEAKNKISEKAVCFDAPKIIAALNRFSNGIHQLTAINRSVETMIELAPKFKVTVRKNMRDIAAQVTQADEKVSELQSHITALSQQIKKISKGNTKNE